MPRCCTVAMASNKLRELSGRLEEQAARKAGFFSGFAFLGNSSLPRAGPFIISSRPADLRGAGRIHIFHLAHITMHILDTIWTPHLHYLRRSLQRCPSSTSSPAAQHTHTRAAITDIAKSHV